MQRCIARARVTLKFALCVVTDVHGRHLVDHEAAGAHFTELWPTVVFRQGMRLPRQSRCEAIFAHVQRGLKTIN